MAKYHEFKELYYFLFKYALLLFLIPIEINAQIENSISSFFKEGNFRVEFERYKLKNHDLIVKKFMKQLEETDQTYQSEYKDIIVFQSIFPMKLFPHDSLFIIYEYPGGCAPIHIYKKGHCNFEKIYRSDCIPTYIKSIYEDSVSNDFHLTTFTPTYISPIISETHYIISSDKISKYKELITVECLEEPNIYLAKSMKALTKNNKNGLFETPKIDTASCTYDDNEVYLKENIFDNLEKNNIVLIHATHKEEDGKTWYFVETSMHNLENAKSYVSDFTQFYLGWMKAEDLVILK